MLTTATMVYLLLAGAAVLVSALLTLQTFEFRRFARSRTRHREPRASGRRVALIVPCCGSEPGLHANLLALFEQDYDAYEPWFVVAGLRDPACGLIRRLMAAYPQHAARLIVAGESDLSGQKVHNLLAATADVPARIAYLAFADSDTRVRPDWLSQLVQHLDKPGVAAATAYRWLIPARSCWPNWLAHSLDASVTALVGPGRHHLVWGGSWAIRREVFVSSGLRDAWRGTLSDDLVAARVLRGLGRVAFEPGAIACCEIDFDWSSLGAFARRQFRVGRLYAPAFWAAATLFHVLQQALVWIGAGVALVPACRGTWTIPAVVAAGLLYTLGALRAWLRQNASRSFLAHPSPQLVAARRFDVLLAPLGGLLACWGLLGALAGSEIVWRGIVYRVSARGRVCSIARPAAEVPVAPTSRRGSRTRRGRSFIRWRRSWRRTV